MWHRSRSSPLRWYHYSLSCHNPVSLQPWVNLEYIIDIHLIPARYAVESLTSLHYMTFRPY